MRILLLLLFLSIGCSDPDNYRTSGKFKSGDVVYILPDYKKGVVKNVYAYRYHVTYFNDWGEAEQIKVVEEMLSLKPGSD